MLNPKKFKIIAKKKIDDAIMELYSFLDKETVFFANKKGEYGWDREYTVRRYLLYLDAGCVKDCFKAQTCDGFLYYKGSRDLKTFKKLYDSIRSYGDFFDVIENYRLKYEPSYREFREYVKEWRKKAEESGGIRIHGSIF